MAVGKSELVCVFVYSYEVFALGKFKGGACRYRFAVCRYHVCGVVDGYFHGVVAIFAGIYIYLCVVCYNHSGRGGESSLFIVDFEFRQFVCGEVGVKVYHRAAFYGGCSRCDVEYVAVGLFLCYLCDYTFGLVRAVLECKRAVFVGEGGGDVDCAFCRQGDVIDGTGRVCLGSADFYLVDRIRPSFGGVYPQGLFDARYVGYLVFTVFQVLDFA